jgi:hypothetical protein
MPLTPLVRGGDISHFAPSKHDEAPSSRRPEAFGYHEPHVMLHMQDLSTSMAIPVFIIIPPASGTRCRTRAVSSRRVRRNTSLGQIAMVRQSIPSESDM